MFVREAIWVGSLALGAACFGDGGGGGGDSGNGETSGTGSGTATEAEAEAGTEGDGAGDDGTVEGSASGAEATSAPGDDGTSASTSGSTTGSSASSGATTSTGADDSAETTWGAGPFYGQCSPIGICDAPEECIGTGSSYVCAAPCETAGDCPPVPADQEARCADVFAPVPGAECVLACEYMGPGEQSNCPSGMQCGYPVGIPLYFCVFGP